MTISSKERKRIEVLDGLRALAILLVLTRHSIRPFWHDLTQPFAKLGPVDFGSIIINGWIGVDLFFVLSGFLITSHLLAEMDRGRLNAENLAVYYKRRFFRVAPAYYVVLTIAVIALLPFFHHADIHEHPEKYVHLGWRYVYHLLFMQDYFKPDIIVVFWSLALEIKFYLIVPFLVLLSGRFKNLGAKLAVPVTILCAEPLLRLVTLHYVPGFTDYHVYFKYLRYMFHLCLDGFMVGMICAYLIHDKKTKTSIEEPVIANLLFYAGLSVFLAVSFSGPLIDLGTSLFEKMFLNTIVALGFGGMMLGLLGGCAGHRFFQGRVLTFIALISYSLYLLHVPVRQALDKYMQGVTYFDALPVPVFYLIYMSAFLLLSAAAATMLYVLVEKPCMDWSRKRKNQ